jgi:hypothetical protein
VLAKLEVAVVEVAVIYATVGEVEATAGVEVATVQSGLLGRHCGSRVWPGTYRGAAYAMPAAPRAKTDTAAMRMRRG